ncbi:MAG: 5-formyltetrahydrofolate cyclo-ligase [Treponema sp.]|jgi:5-formyltetrahydrofolate cyclo-ligase|nr:5-formyltetrahydrofolate cyclo-ligase [Treponema sp.]
MDAGSLAEKDTLRRQHVSILKTLDSFDAERAGRSAARLLTALLQWNDCPALLCFLSIKGEIDTSAIIAAAFTGGKSVFAPRVEGSRLCFYKLDTTKDLRRGAFGVREPAAAAKYLPEPGVKPLVLCPGLAFDAAGGRLGRGRGYYDRFLAGAERAFTAIGVCLDCQLVKKVPLAAHDYRMDYILTPAKLITVTR